jgi:hypothetical protein
MIVFLVLPNILAMGRAAFMRVPVSEANDISHLLEACCRRIQLASLNKPVQLTCRSPPHAFKKHPYSAYD